LLKINYFNSVQGADIQKAMKQKSYAHGVSMYPLLGETIGENLRKTRHKFPEREALVSVHQNYRATYSELWQQTTTVAKALLAINVKKGDCVAIWSPNRYEWVLVQYATARIGAILVNINPAYRASELAYVLCQSGATMLISAVGNKNSDYKSVIAETRSECKNLREVIFFDKDWERFLYNASGINDEELEAVESTLQFDDPINIQYTSGTTGFPKGVTLSHYNILNNGYFTGIRLKYTEEDKVCIPVPLYHCFGMVIGNLCCTSTGACIVLPSETFEPTKVLQAVEKERCTSLYGVPTMFIAELQLPGFHQFDLSSLRKGVMAGSPCPVEVMRKVQSRMNMKDVQICYGMTETSPVSTQTSARDSFEKRIGTVGTVQDHLEIKIIDPETGELRDRNIPGELCTRGYSVMLGYWNNSRATDEVIDQAGWMHTGDLAVMDEEGYINIVGRSKDVILRGGENIYPREIEEFLYTHEAIADVQVIGIPSERFGEEVMAWVKIKNGYYLTKHELRQFCNQKIARYKIPTYWKFVDSFPLTVTGKIRKIEMREAAIKELGLQEVAKIKTA
jgi:fatty-acyl-CoA synthase